MDIYKIILTILVLLLIFPALAIRAKIEEHRRRIWENEYFSIWRSRYDQLLKIGDNTHGWFWLSFDRPRIMASRVADELVVGVRQGYPLPVILEMQKNMNYWAAVLIRNIGSEEGKRMTATELHPFREAIAYSETVDQLCNKALGENYGLK